MMSDKVIILEAFNGGSHKQLVDYLESILSEENVEVIKCTMTAKKWHWRMRTSALYFSQHLPEIDTKNCR